MGNRMNKIILIIASILFANTAYATSETALSLKVYNADSHSFHVNSTLIYGETEAAIIDAGFTKADALRIAANVLDSGKKLTTIFISQADPDYYFGTETLKQIFPNAQIITTLAVQKVIQSKMAGKLAFWGPKMGNNAPDSPILPKTITDSAFTVDGYKVEIHGTSGLLAHRPYLWIPSIKALVGNIGIFGNLHVWTADTQSQQKLDAWQVQLAEMQGLNPLIAVPGHMAPNTSLTPDNINYTALYLKKFEQEKQQSTNAEELINKMLEAYPNALFPLALNIGAKVHMGEMKW